MAVVGEIFQVQSAAVDRVHLAGDAVVELGQLSDELAQVGGAHGAACNKQTTPFRDSIAKKIFLVRN